MTITQQIKAARRVSTPLVAITTPDQPALVSSLVESFNGSAPPIVQWDFVRAITPLNEAGQQAVQQAVPPPDMPGLPPPGQNPFDALVLAAKFPRRTIFLMHNAHLVIVDSQGAPNPPVIQAIANLRDQFKSDFRTLVLLAPAMRLPIELQQDVLLIDDPLPDELRLGEIVDATMRDAREAKPEIAELKDAERARVIEALAGLAAFPAEQTLSMAIDVDAGRVDVPAVWTRKRQTANQTDGIVMLDDATLPTFADLGGLSEAKQHARDLFTSRRPPRLVVWIDEAEKSFGGLGTAGGPGDNTGATQDQLRSLLMEMEFREHSGMIAVGPPGAGKSLFARSVAREFGRPLIMLDLGAMKASRLGESEARVRNAMKVLRAVAGDTPGSVYFVATCNDLAVLPAELKRRFKSGVWFFDLPDAEERAAIWAVNLARYELQGAARTFDDDQWTGAEIRNVCEAAWMTGRSLDDCARRIVPTYQADAERIKRLRAMALGKFNSASYVGHYRGPAVETATRPRAFQQE